MCPARSLLVGLRTPGDAFCTPAEEDPGRGGAAVSWPLSLVSSGTSQTSPSVGGTTPSTATATCPTRCWTSSPTSMVEAGRRSVLLVMLTVKGEQDTVPSLRFRDARDDDANIIKTGNKQRVSPRRRRVPTSPYHHGCHGSSSKGAAARSPFAFPLASSVCHTLRLGAELAVKSSFSFVTSLQTRFFLTPPPPGRAAESGRLADN